MDEPLARTTRKFRPRRFLAEDRTRTGTAWAVYDRHDDTVMFFTGIEREQAVRVADELEANLNPDPNPEP